MPVACLLLLAAWVSVSDTAKSSVACGSAPYFLVGFSIVPAALAITAWMRARLLRCG